MAAQIQDYLAYEKYSEQEEGFIELLKQMENMHNQQQLCCSFV
jgi:hypothetical protein